MTRPARGRSARRWTALVAVALIGSSLAGCAQDAPVLRGGVSRSLQAQVQALANAAAEGDYSTASVLLTEIESYVSASGKAGDISADRQLELQPIIDKVRADLAELAAGSPQTAEPSATSTPPPVVPTAEEVPPADDSSSNGDTGNNTQDGSGNSNNGNGNGNNGNGKGKGKKD